MTKVYWTDEELAMVQEEVLHLYLTQPEMSTTDLLSKAQDGLDDDRKRAIRQFSAAQNLFDYLKRRCAELYAIHKKSAAADGGQPVPLPSPPPRTDNQKEALAAQAKALQAQVAQLQAQVVQLTVENLQMKVAGTPSVEELVANIPTQQLFYLLFTRVAPLLGRQQQEGGLSEDVLRRLSADRHALETRFTDLQSSVNKIAMSVELPQAPAPAEEQVYMPNFLTAGLKREDFQRLQMSLTKASIRVSKLDVSQPDKISVPRHDRFFVYVRGLTKDLASSLPNRSQTSVIVDGTLQDMQSVILKEADKVRDEVAQK